MAAIISDVEGRIFATQRGYGEFKDMWEFPGGKVVAGFLTLSRFQNISSNQPHRYLESLFAETMKTTEDVFLDKINKIQNSL
ncbi:MAG: hypothetical protein ACI3ZQ_06215 [Candidatus Cryptobacteroides sp.]